MRSNWKGQPARAEVAAMSKRTEQCDRDAAARWLAEHERKANRRLTSESNGPGPMGGQPPSHKTNPRPSLSHGGVQHQRYLPALLATLNAAPFRVRAVELRHQHGMSSRARLPVQAALCHRHRRGQGTRAAHPCVAGRGEAMKYHAPTAAERVREILRGLAQTGARRERAPGFA